MSTHSAAPPMRHDFLGYAMLAIQFLRLAENCCDELVARDNATVVVMDGTNPIDFHTHEQMTRWSDTQIASPILFSYLHGIELMLKAFLAQAGRLPTKKAHKLTQLLALFLEDHGNSELATLLRQCVLEFEPHSPLACFLSQNGESIDSWYETLNLTVLSMARAFRWISSREFCCKPAAAACAGAAVVFGAAGSALARIPGVDDALGLSLPGAQELLHAAVVGDGLLQ